MSFLWLFCLLLFLYVFLLGTLTGVLAGVLAGNWKDGSKYAALASVCLALTVTYYEGYYMRKGMEEKLPYFSDSDVYHYQITSLVDHVYMLSGLFIAFGLVWTLIYMSTDLKETEEFLVLGWLGALVVATAFAWTNPKRRFGFNYFARKLALKEHLRR